MTSQDAAGWVCRMGRAATSACWRGLARSLWWLPSSSGCTARGVGCYWTRVGCTLGRWGLRAVRTTLGQWIPTLVEQADSRQSRRRVIASKPLRRRRAGNGGGEPATEAPGCAVRTPNSLLRGPVSTVLTLTGPTSMFPAGIVGILRFFFVVRRRCACDVSTMDTDSPSRPIPSAPLSPPGPPACPRFPPERVSQKS